MDHFAGLDVSVKETRICIVDETGLIVRQVKVPSEPEALLQVLMNPAYHLKRIGLEAGPLSQWLFSALAEAGLPVICVETRHVKAVLMGADQQDGPQRCTRHRTDDASGALSTGACENDLRSTLRNFGLKVAWWGQPSSRGASGACREAPRYNRAGRTAAHCPAGASRTDRHSASPFAGPGR